MGNENSVIVPINRYLIVGKNVTMIHTRVDRYTKDDKLEKFVLEYFAGFTSRAQLLLETTKDKDGATNLVRLETNEPGLITFFIERAENNLLKPVNTDDIGKIGKTNFVKETSDCLLRDVTKTNVAYKGSEDEGSLIVVEQKRKNGVEKPYVVTVAHYYAISRHSLFGLKSYEAGLSMTVNVTVFNNELFLVRSHRHNISPAALLPMFQQVCKTKTWKWSTCPYSHAENCRKQFIRMNSSETETETEDEEGRYVQFTKQIGSNFLAIQGPIHGKNNCNVVVKKLILEARK